MGLILLVARVLLAVAFVVTGLAKLANRTGAWQVLSDYGAPALLTTPLRLVLPLLQLAVAVALLPTRSAWWGALGALVLLLLFVAGIGVSLARGRTTDCNCFGPPYCAPPAGDRLIYNGVLAAVAGFIVWQGGHNAGASVVSWFGALTIAQGVGLIGTVAVLGLLATEGWVLAQLLGQNRRLLARLAAVEAQPAISGKASAVRLPVGATAPGLQLSGPEGQTITLDTLRASGKSDALLFSDPSCGPGTALLPEIGCCWHLDHAATVTIFLLSRGTPEAEASSWQFRNKETSFAIFPSAVDAQLIINGQPLFIPKGTMLGKIDFMPNGKYIFDPGARSYALAEFFDGWEAFFRCTVRAMERNMIGIRPPTYLMGDTKEEKMANFTKRVGFDIIRFDGLGYTLIVETNTVREKFAALKTRSVNGKPIEERLMRRAKREEERTIRA